MLVDSVMIFAVNLLIGVGFLAILFSIWKSLTLPCATPSKKASIISLRCLALAFGLFVASASKVYNSPLHQILFTARTNAPELSLVSEAEVIGPDVRYEIAYDSLAGQTVVIATTILIGLIVAFFYERVSSKPGEKSVRLLISTQVVFALLYVDIYAKTLQIDNHDLTNNIQSITPNLSFLTGCLMYWLFIRREKAPS